jgi:DNA-binding MarR family transcriptional regulator
MLQSNHYDIMMSIINQRPKMNRASKRTPAGEVITALTLDIFRLNNLLLNAGDRLVTGLGLTSARWQILGAIARAEHSQPVAWLARNMGANRQNVQRIVNDLHDQGHVIFEANPHHRRAQLVVLTEKGRMVYDAAMALQAPWVNRVTEGLSLQDLAAFERVLLALRARLEASE